jgi:pentatricopeptide repeat protein
VGKLTTDTFNEQIRAFFKSGCVKDGLMLMKEMEENMLLSILTSFKKFRSSSQSTYLWARIPRN